MTYPLLCRLGLAAGLVALTGCPSDPALDPGTGDSTGAGSTGTTSSNITASTIDPSASISVGQSSSSDDDDDDDDDDDSTTSSVSATTGESTSTGEPPDEGTSTGPGSRSDSVGSESSSSGAGSESSGSTGDCGTPMGPGNYDACLDAMSQPDSLMCGFGGAVCINDGGDPAFVSVCTQPACVDSCDCPPGPGSGSASPVCEDITADMDPECYLDCSSGETCPDGMACFINAICVHDSGTGGNDWGPCEGAVECPVGDLCIVDDTMAPTQGVCSDQGCTLPADCPAPPSTGDAPVICSDITGPPNDCWLDCGSMQTCPDGMMCFSSFLCMWPLP